jgi:hypothetical protein
MECPCVVEPANYPASTGLARIFKLYIIPVTGYIYR